MDHPTFGNGKICYIEIPCSDINASANFYTNVFGWVTRMSNDGRLSFDDGVGEVSGAWVIGPKPATEAGITISIMVDNMQATVELINKNGGKMTQPFDLGSKQKIASFADPFGNVFGLYQHGG